MSQKLLEITAGQIKRTGDLFYTKDEIDALVGGVLILQGAWDALTNSPDISGTTTTGYAWRVSVAGSTNLGGITTWEIGDLAVKTSTGWLRVNNSDVAAVWGNISGTLADQTDLYAILQYLKKVVVSFGISGLYSIDGSQSAILTNTRRFVKIPFAATITGWHIMENSPTPVTGSIVVDVWKSSSYSPTVSNTIAGSEKPTLSSQTNNSDTNLTTWTTSVSANDWIGFNVDSVNGCKNVLVELTLEKA